MKKKHSLLPMLMLPASILPITGVFAQNSSATKTQKPNVIFIYADDIGYGDLDWVGSETIVTPNVAKLASEGIRFTNAHSAAATSTPSRYAMLTGEYAWRKEGTGIARGDAGMIIRPERFTLSDMFKEAGYTTAAIGKWHLGLGDKTGEQNWNEQLKPGLMDIGFDYSFIMAATGDRVPCVFVENDTVVNRDLNDPIYTNYEQNFPGQPTGKDNPELLTLHPSDGHDQSIINGIPRIGYMIGGKAALWKDEEIADKLTANAVSFIEENKDQPFFLYFATQDAHVPRVPGPRFAGKSGMGTRGDALMQFDWSVSEVMNTLKRLGLDENTIVILSSDNGPVVDDGYADNAVALLGNHKPGGKFRGGKYSAFEAGTRVPCILRWKGEVKPANSDALMCQIDWFASLASLLNVSLPKDAAPDSENLLNTWLGKEKQGRKYLVTQNIDNNLSISTDTWKYLEQGEGIFYHKETNIEWGNSPKPRLYNLKKDAGEQKDLITKEKKVAENLQKKLEEIKKQ